MTEALIMTLLPAMNIAAFSRHADGSFAAITPSPSWFPRLADTTFPFLGHILDEANEFWRSGESGSREFGPCAETDENGREFHYRVRALTAGETGSQFLVFELDPGADHLRGVLQKAREHALQDERAQAKYDRRASQIRRGLAEILQLLDQFAATSTDAQSDLVDLLRVRCHALIRRME